MCIAGASRFIASSLRLFSPSQPKLRSIQSHSHSTQATPAQLTQSIIPIWLKSSRNLVSHRAQIRLPNGAKLQHTFKPTDTMATVVDWIKANRNDGGRFDSFSPCLLELPLLWFSFLFQWQYQCQHHLPSQGLHRG